MALEKHWVAALEDHGPGVAAHHLRNKAEDGGSRVGSLEAILKGVWRLMNDLAAHIGRGLRSEIIRKRLDVCVGELGCDGSHDAVVVRACPGA